MIRRFRPHPLFILFFCSMRGAWRAFFVVSAIMLPSCSSPIAPQQSSTYSGGWVGTHTVTSMRGGADLRAAGRFPHTGKLKLTLTQTGISVSGTLVIDGPVPWSEATGRFMSQTIPVAGAVDASGDLSLSGSAQFMDPVNSFSPGPSSVRLIDWHSSRNGDVLTGQLHATVAGFYGGGPEFPQTFEFTSNLTAKPMAVAR
jgi:hypothetical protein